MKKILSFILAASMSLSLFALDIFSYVPLKGNVKNYTETNFVITSKFGNYFRTPDTKVIHTLNTSGKEVELTELTARDAIIAKTVSTYDVYGNLTDQACYDAEQNLIWKSVTTYNGAYKADVSEYKKDGTLKSKTIYTYTNGLLVDETGYDGEGALVWKTIYKYDDANRLSTIDEYNSDGSLSVETTYAYSEAEKIDSITVFDNYTKLTEQKVFRYASNGSLSEITTYNNDKEIVKRLSIKYDNGGNVAKLSEYNIAQKFGTTVNDLVAMSEFIYQ